MNKIVSTIAIGGAAYLLRNKESRSKVINQLKSIVSPETIEKIKNQFLSLSNQTLKENSDQPKLLESSSGPTAIPDYVTTARANTGRP
ncbi:hypothetical protein J7E81_11570 [Bacillus sp. ISL-18]|uniref:hypothetical protein n=1 Tax=Bacillus sp. ISL-18 TaxID=2819118 RepID=UPI001BEB1F20|nr:hypothetical protein [Bacillus sp. ISL-18]MBT2655864.1 hypothetical protein [Bacillus sp. ISL-18]